MVEVWCIVWYIGRRRIYPKSIEATVTKLRTCANRHVFVGAKSSPILPKRRKIYGKHHPKTKRYLPHPSLLRL